VQRKEKQHAGAKEEKVTCWKKEGKQLGHIRILG
jgi:hypothetical protein